MVTEENMENEVGKKPKSANELSSQAQHTVCLQPFFLDRKLSLQLYEELYKWISFCVASHPTLNYIQPALGIHRLHPFT